MSKVKNKFTLHTEYRKTIHGTDKNEILMEVISPQIPNIASFVMGIIILVVMIPMLFSGGGIVVIRLIQRQMALDPWMFTILAFGYFGTVWWCWMLAQDLRQFLYARRHRAALALSDIRLRGKITGVFRYGFSKHSNDHSVRICYQFQAPDRTILKGFAGAYSQDLKGKPQPSVGTPVTVLYADDGSHMML